MRLENFNDDFVLIHTERGTAFGRMLLDRTPDFAREVLVTETEICLPLRRPFTPADADWVRAQFARLKPSEATPVTTRQLPLTFTDHADWTAVEDHSGLSRTAVERLLTETEFQLAQFGFLPGFVYLTGLPNALQVPRKATPARHVAAGSVAIGGKYLGVYPTDSPGGWHVIGRVTTPIFQPDRLPPVAWQLGDTVRLCPV